MTNLYYEKLNAISHATSTILTQMVFSNDLPEDYYSKEGLVGSDPVTQHTITSLPFHFLPTDRTEFSKDPILYLATYYTTKQITNGKKAPNFEWVIWDYSNMNISWKKTQRSITNLKHSIAIANQNNLRSIVLAILNRILFSNAETRTQRELTRGSVLLHRKEINLLHHLLTTEEVCRTCGMPKVMVQSKSSGEVCFWCNDPQ